jgi:uncharacterized protein YecE (DUF72 family)
MIRVGVAGWDYEDWNGRVYPPGAGRELDRLAYLAELVELIEINSTFYRPVRPRVAESWVRRVASHESFVFTAKAHRGWTHEQPLDVGLAVPPTLEGLKPLHEAERLGALLLQFPQSVRWGPSARERLARLSEAARGWPLVVEVRHASWGADEAGSWLAEQGLGWCWIDQPRVGPATLGGLRRVTAERAYMRLHGRNAANWFRRDAGRDARYDYLYADDELQGFAATARALAAEAPALFVVMNNHFRGQALVNALQLRRRLEGVPPIAPASLVDAYPGLADSVKERRDGLF